MIEQGYDFFLADTDAGKSIHFGLRYQVYCLRERYEDPGRHPNFLEQDEYDDSAVHFIARCKTSGEWVGAMRVIVAPVQELPVYRYSFIDNARISRPEWTRAAEASRLCTLLPNARHRFSPASSRTDKALQTSWVVMGLIRAGREYCIRNGVSYGFFLISDPLARILRRLGMDIEPVGSPCQHRGWRRPYIHNVKSGYQAMAARAPELYKAFSQYNAYTPFSRMQEDSPQELLAAIA